MAISGTADQLLAEIVILDVSTSITISPRLLYIFTYNRKNIHSDRNFSPGN